ncbi:hypothetical protein EON67_05320 [archaeon]|nr:MAG: hypothetical protein EON67_05320 [archaeon]
MQRGRGGGDGLEVSRMLGAGANIEATSQQDASHAAARLCTPLHADARTGYAHVVELLLLMLAAGVRAHGCVER